MYANWGTLFALLCVSINVTASPLFDDHTVFEIELTGPVAKTISDRKDKTEYPFLLKADGSEHEVQVRVRGNSRLRVCNFPPLRLNFSRKDIDGSVFAGQDKLKLVTHCRGRPGSQSDAIEEFAAYRIFNLLSDVSYKVRLLRIIYIDTDKPGDKTKIERYGFLIESLDELVDRTNGQAVNVTGVSLSSLDNDHAAIVYIFQYLIGNTDWSLVKSDRDEFCCHNGDLLDIDARRYYVPYDFDLSGLVNARYAYPDPALPIRRVTQRMYRGYCISRDSLQAALDLIKAHKLEILGVIEEIPGLPEDDRVKDVKYLDQFFVRAEDEDRLLSSFERRCL
jgi:hypothetical protein